jgi:hypothetical protein
VTLGQMRMNVTGITFPARRLGERRAPSRVAGDLGQPRRLGPDARAGQGGDLDGCLERAVDRRGPAGAIAPKRETRSRAWFCGT